MTPPGACPRCLSPLPARPEGGLLICPGCGSRITGDTPPVGDTRATNVEPRPPTAVPDTITAHDPHFAPTASGPADGFTLAAEAPPPTLPGYDDLTLLGTGGMGVVYRAVQRGTGRTVAVKFLHAGGSLDRALRARFVGEAHALARVDHPNIVRIHDAAEDEFGRPYFSMEYVPGGSLGRRLRAGPVDPRGAARIVAAVASAVEAAHRVRVLHRDLKPANVLLAADGTPKVTDFGLAKLGDRDDGPTVSGAIMGTPSYMAPEQAAGHRHAFDPRIDVYGLGAVLYELLTDRPPYKGPTSAATLRLVERADLVPPSRLCRSLHPDLEAVCVKCLAKDPAARYPTAQAVADDLDRFLAGKPTLARPLSRWGKARSWARRHRVAVAAAAVLAIAVPGAAVSDPGRRNDLLLAAGRPVTIIGETGGPSWHEWRLGPVDLTRSAAEDGSCGFQTHTTSVLVLARDPRWSSYTVEVDLKHINSQSDAAYVGVFVGLYDTPARPGLSATRFVGFHYSDKWREAELKMPWLKAKHGLDAKDMLVVVGGDRVEVSPNCDYGVAPFVPAHRPPKHPWRHIRIDVTPAGVEAYWEPTPTTTEPAHRLTAARIAGKVADQNAFWPRLFPGFEIPERHWNPRGAVGVYACDAAVAVRNFKIRPSGDAP